MAIECVPFPETAHRSLCTPPQTGWTSLCQAMTGMKRVERTKDYVEGSCFERSEMR